MYTCLIVDYVMQTARALSKCESRENKRDEKKKQPKEAKKREKCKLDLCVCVCVSHHTPTEVRSMTKHQMDCKEAKILRANLCGTWINGDLKLQRLRSTKRCASEKNKTHIVFVVVVVFYSRRFFCFDRMHFHLSILFTFFFCYLPDSVFIFDDELDLCVHEAA